MDTQPLGGAVLSFYFSMGVFEHQVNVSGDHLIQAELVLFLGRGYQRRGCPFLKDILASPGDQCAFNMIFKFPDIAGPGLLLKLFYVFGRKGGGKRLIFNSLDFFSAKWVTRAGMSSGRCLRGGMMMGNTFSRYQRSSRKLPSSTICSRFLWEALMTRTSTDRDFVPPTRSIFFS